MADALTASLALAMLVASGLCAPAGAAGLVDPTQPPPGYAATAAGTDARSAPVDIAPEPVRLQMIARNGSSRLAVVNGYHVHAGDSITLDGKSAQVVSIGDASVVLLKDGHRQILELTPRSALGLVCAAHSSHRSNCRDDLLGASR